MNDLNYIRQLCQDHVEDLARILLPGGKKNGRYWQAGSINGEPGQSLKLNLSGDRQGYWKDFESGEGGDLIDLWQRVMNCSFGDCIQQIKQQFGVDNSIVPKSSLRFQQKKAVSPPPPSQINAHVLQLFYQFCLKAAPEAHSKGIHYLYQRGVLPEPWYKGVLALDAIELKKTLDLCLNSEFKNEFEQNGLLKEGEKGLRLPWWDSVVLFFCFQLNGLPGYVLGRRVLWQKGDRVGKWINMKGSPIPYGLPALDAAALGIQSTFWPTSNTPELLIVEGPIDALAAQCLGFNAIAILGKISSRNILDNGKVQQMFSPYLDLLKKVSRITILPDNDGPEKSKENHQQALALADWLWLRGIKANVMSIQQLTHQNHKDLADFAKANYL